ncbi:MAG: nucleoside deaminase [archaeon]
MDKTTDEKKFIAEALKEAQKAFERKECPVGAVIVQNGVILARDGNRESELNDPTAHAEILVLREAGRILNRHTFPDCTIYTTLWPCPMCENAMLRAKILRVVAGARSYKYIYKNTFDSSNLEKSGPLMEKECRELYLKWAKETKREFILSKGDWPAKSTKSKPHIYNLNG